MKNYLLNMLDKYHELAPYSHPVHQMYVEDLYGRDGEIYPSRPLALQTMYHLDDHTGRRDLHGLSYDALLDDEQKELIDLDFLDLAEQSALLNQPFLALDESMDEHLSENRKTARNALKNIDTEEELKNLQKGMTDLFVESLFSPNNNLKMLNHPMTDRSGHHPDDYERVLFSTLIHPAIEGHDRWNAEKVIPHLKKFRG